MLEPPPNLLYQSIIDFFWNSATLTTTAENLADTARLHHRLPQPRRSNVMPEAKKIYIIDDDESVLRALGFLIGTFGFQVKTFASADSFLKAVSQDTPDCLVLDVHMPGIDGMQLQQQLVSAGSKLPIIFISADKDPVTAERAMKAGAVGFLQKPFNDRALSDLIDTAIKK